MKQRIISAFIMLPMLVFVWLGNVPLMVFSIILSAMAMKEFYDGYTHIDIRASKLLGWIFLALLYVIVIWGEFMNGDGIVYAHLIQMWMFGAVVVGLVMTVFRKDNNILDGPITSLGIFYLGFFMAHLTLIDRLPRYSKFTWAVFIIAFGTDIFAYFTGYFLGKHKLCPRLSPKKTIEGAVGGVVGSTVLTCLFGYLVYPEIMIHCAVMGLIGSVFAQLGDLTASAFKRKMGIKDYSNLIPGHGGVLDRIDSVLFTAPFVYYYVIVFVKP